MRNHKINRIIHANHSTFPFSSVSFDYFQSCACIDDDNIQRLKWRLRIHDNAHFLIAVHRLLWNLSHGYYKMNRLVRQCQSFLVDWIMKSLEWIAVRDRMFNAHISRYIFNSLTATDQCFKWYSNAFAFRRTKVREGEKKPWSDNDLFNKKKLEWGRKRFSLTKSIKNRYDD